MREAGSLSNNYLNKENLQSGNPLLLANTTLYCQLKALLPAHPTR